jgi:hypothetical protein
MNSPYDTLQSDVYALRTEGDGLRVTKLSKDLNPVGFYHLTPSGDFYTCNCPQSNRGPCKHLDIVDAFSLYPERIDNGWFYSQQTGDWYPPVGGEAVLDPAFSPGSGEDVIEPPHSPEVAPAVEPTPPSVPAGASTFRRF